MYNSFLEIIAGYPSMYRMEHLDFITCSFSAEKVTHMGEY